MVLAEGAAYKLLWTKRPRTTPYMPPPDPRLKRIILTNPAFVRDGVLLQRDAQTPIDLTTVLAIMREV